MPGMAITFRQLEIFVAAAKSCSFRLTADQFAITQPSVSNHIRSLETHLGCSLFLRRQGVAPVLTFEGMRFLEKARSMVARRAGVAGPDHPSCDVYHAQLTIMAGPLLFDTCIRPRLGDFCSAHPELALQFVGLHPTKSAEHLVASGQIDIAIFTGEPPDAVGLQCETIESVGRSIYASPTLALRANQPGVNLGELPWVMPPVSFAPTRSLWRCLLGAGIRPRNITARSQFPDVVAGMAVEGRGITVLFDDFASTMIAEGRIMRTGPRLPDTSRVLLIGQRARHASCRPVIDLLRLALRTPLGPLPFPFQDRNLTTAGL